MCWGLWSGSVVCGYLAAGQWASSRARCPRRIVWWGGGVGWGARLRWGGRPALLSPVPPPRAHGVPWPGATVTAIVAYAGASAAAVAVFASGSTSGWGRCAKLGGASCWHPDP